MTPPARPNGIDRSARPAGAPASGPPADRLAVSRAEIERWLAQDRGDPLADPLEDPAGDLSPSGPAVSNAGGHRPRSRPGPATLLVGAVATAWLQRPSQVPWQAAGVLADAALAPLARRHPWALTGAAVGVGMAVGVLRPWRWLLRPAVLAGLLTPVVAQLAARCLPVQGALPEGSDSPASPPIHP